MSRIAIVAYVKYKPKLLSPRFLSVNTAMLIINTNMICATVKTILYIFIASLFLGGAWRKGKIETMPRYRRGLKHTRRMFALYYYSILLKSSIFSFFALFFLNNSFYFLKFFKVWFYKVRIIRNALRLLVMLMSDIKQNYRELWLRLLLDLLILLPERSMCL